MTESLTQAQERLTQLETEFEKRKTTIEGKIEETEKSKWDPLSISLQAELDAHEARYKPAIEKARAAVKEARDRDVEAVKAQETGRATQEKWQKAAFEEAWPAIYTQMLEQQVLKNLATPTAGDHHRRVIGL